MKKDLLLLKCLTEIFRPADLKMPCPLPDVVDKEQKDPEVFAIRKHWFTSNSDDDHLIFTPKIIFTLIINSQLFRRQMLVLRRYFSDLFSSSFCFITPHHDHDHYNLHPHSNNQLPAIPPSNAGSPALFLRPPRTARP